MSKNKIFALMIFLLISFQAFNQTESKLPICCDSIGTLTITGDTIACCNDSVMLCVPFDSCLTYQWHWLNGNTWVHLGSSNCMFANNSGLYYVEAWNNCDTVQTSPFYVNIITNIPNWVDLIASDTVICEGDSAILHVTDSLDCLHYIWIVDGDTLSYFDTNNFYAHDSASYSVIVYNECDSAGSAVTLGPINIHVSNVFANIYGLDKIRCQTCGWAASVNYGGGFAPYTILWSSGENTAYADDLCIGTIGVTVTDAFGCSATDVEYRLESRFGASVSCSNKNLYFCNLTANPVGGHLPYAYLWSNGNTSQTITAALNLIYSVTVTDGAGCTLVRTGKCSMCAKNSAIEEDINSSISISIYPNPANQTVYIDLPIEYSEQNLIIKIYDFSGKEVSAVNSSNSNTVKIDVQKLNKGIYLIEIISDLETVKERIVIDN